MFESSKFLPITDSSGHKKRSGRSSPVRINHGESSAEPGGSNTSIFILPTCVGVLGGGSSGTMYLLKGFHDDAYQFL